MSTKENWARKKVIVGDVFSYVKDHKPKTDEECQHINDWLE